MWFSRVLILKSTIFFTNSVSKIPYLCDFGPETSKCFGLSETRYSEDFKATILNSTIVFSNSILKSLFLDKFDPEFLKCFDLNETRYTRVFKDAYS